VKKQKRHYLALLLVPGLMALGIVIGNPAASATGSQGGDSHHTTCGSNDHQSPGDDVHSQEPKTSLVSYTTTSKSGHKDDGKDKDCENQPSSSPSPSQSKSETPCPKPTATSASPEPSGSESESEEPTPEPTKTSATPEPSSSSATPTPSGNTGQPEPSNSTNTSSATTPAATDTPDIGTPPTTLAKTGAGQSIWLLAGLLMVAAGIPAAAFGYRKSHPSGTHAAD